MNRKLLILGLVCLLSHSMRAEKESSSSAGRNLKTSGTDTSGVVQKSSKVKVSSASGARSSSWCFKNCFTGWSTCKKVSAGLATAGTAVWLMYKYGCRCCPNTKKRVVKADA